MPPLLQGGALVLLALLGLGVSLWTYSAKRRHATLACPVGKGCEAVLQSRYSTLLGIPHEVWGLLYYGGVIAAGALLFLGVSSLGSVGVLAVLRITGTLAAAYAVTLAGIQACILREWCDLCLASTAASVLIAVTAFL